MLPARQATAVLDKIVLPPFTAAKPALKKSFAQSGLLLTRLPRIPHNLAGIGFVTALDLFQHRTRSLIFKAKKNEKVKLHLACFHFFNIYAMD